VNNDRAADAPSAATENTFLHAPKKKDEPTALGPLLDPFGEDVKQNFVILKTLAVGR